MISREIQDMAPWTDWVPLMSADPPPSPGVYLARQGAGGPVVYVGVGAGDRKGGGLCGRLRRYTSGKALTSGLGEGLFDRALADRDWLRERLTEVERADRCGLLSGARPHWPGLTCTCAGLLPKAASRLWPWRAGCWRFRAWSGGTGRAEPLTSVQVFNDVSADRIQRLPPHRPLHSDRPPLRRFASSYRSRQDDRRLTEAAPRLSCGCGELCAEVTGHEERIPWVTIKLCPGTARQRGGPHHQMRAPAVRREGSGGRCVADDGVLALALFMRTTLGGTRDSNSLGHATGQYGAFSPTSRCRSASAAPNP